jgi:hypothetical protein
LIQIPKQNDTPIPINQNEDILTKLLILVIIATFFLYLKVFLMGIIRLVMTVYSCGHHKIAADGEKKRRIVLTEKQKES